MKVDKNKPVRRQVKTELKHHIPFTVFGALTGIFLFVLLKDLPKNISYNIFYILHPIHVLFSGIVTASLYAYHRYRNKNRKINFFTLLIVGYIGAIGIATLSDSLIPYLGETLLKMPEKQIHLGFIEKWWLINPLAVLGVIIAYYRPNTKIPHASHVLLSTYASLFHVIMSLGNEVPLSSYIFIMLFLFIAVWLPCCISDIIFPVTLAETENKK